MYKYVGDQMEYGFSDGDYLPIEKCVCGAEFDWWEFSISIYENTPTECPKCGRKFFFTTHVSVWEVIDD
jgi:DNA-directed RNA polymerase subunit RPC12/RpoP